MSTTKERLITVLLVTTLLLASALSGAAPAGASERGGNGQNPGCEICEACDDDGQLKIDPVPHPGTTSQGPFTISVIDTDKGEVLDWTASGGVQVHCVIVKGGEGGYELYTYDPPATSGSGLHTPVNQSGYYAEISHVTFCYESSTPPTCDLSVTVEPDPVELCCESPATTLNATVTGGQSPRYQWYMEGSGNSVVTLSGETGSSLTVESSGTYFVRVTDGDCAAESNHVSVTRNTEDAPRVTVTPPSAQLVCPGNGGVVLTATPELGQELAMGRVKGLAAPLGAEYAIQWYKNGSPINGATGLTYTATGPGVYWVLIDWNGCTGESNHVQVRGCDEPEPPCPRPDVSVIVNGGWAGIAVKAWVGGTEQPTQHTALDSSGRPAVLWTFYPSEGETWSVRVEPQLPAGFDPAAWKFEPTSKTVSVKTCRPEQVSFQLVNTQPGPTVILPVTGGEPSWWRSLLTWFRGLFD